jgi:hypothetical protein
MIMILTLYREQGHRYVSIEQRLNLRMLGGLTEPRISSWIVKRVSTHFYPREMYARTRQLTNAESLHGSVHNSWNLVQEREAAAAQVSMSARAATLAYP